MTNSRSGHWILLYLGSLLVLFGSQAAVVFIADPLQFFRPDEVYPGGLQRLLNVGLARTQDYTGAVIGTSLSENFYLADLATNLDRDYVNLSISGSSAFEQGLMAKVALRKDAVKEIIWEIDIYALKGGSERRDPQFDDALVFYDSNPFNDLKYFIGGEFLKLSVCKLLQENKRLETCGDNPFSKRNIGRIHSWYKGHIRNFKPKNVSKNFNQLFSSIQNSAQKEKFFEQFSLKRLSTSFDSNVLSVIDRAPNVQFKLIFPPYSILFLEKFRQVDRASLDFFLRFKEYVGRVSEDRHNIEIHDFQVMFSHTKNINNYKDVRHYNLATSKAMLDSIRTHTYQIGSEAEAKINSMRIISELESDFGIANRQ